MSGLDWLAVGLGPILVLISLSVLFYKRAMQSRKRLLDRIDQLSHQLHERLSEQKSEQNQEMSSITQEVLEILRESEEQQPALDSSVLSSGMSSIHPVKESIAALSKRISTLEPKQLSQDDPQSFNLASLAVSYIRTHMNEVIRVEEISSELNVTSGKLYTCLKESLNCSVQELIIVVKMQEAKKLLGQGDLLVKQVASELGFWSPYHFSSRFKMVFGLSPNQYKERYQQHRRTESAKKEQVNYHQAKRLMNGQEEIHHQLDKVKSQKSTATEGLPAGTAIDRFLIVNRIGHGGMGVVYKAYDPKLNRGVALKLIRADRADSNQSQLRLLREAQALAKLSHPNVLHVYDVGTFVDQVYMTMALVEGRTLKGWLKEQKRSIKEILKVMTAAGRGLSAAHKAGLVHRDFKPSNVIVGNDGQVRVLDFGLAREISSRESMEDGDEKLQEEKSVQSLESFSSGDSSNLLMTPLTHAGNILGTPTYMAPEQYLGQKTDERTDQFGFCVVLYKALYRRRPFAARSIEDLKSEVIREQVVVPPLNTEVPIWLWKIVRKGLSANPDDRYATLDSLLADLDKDPEQERQQKLLARKRKLFVAALILLIVALPIAVWYGLRYRTVQLCKAVDGEFAGVWDSATKAEIQKAFLDTGKSYAQGTWERVEKIVDRYLADWTHMRSDVCEAWHISGTQSDELFDLSMGCFKKRKQELKALTKVLAKADAEILRKAVQASSSLAGINHCADEEALRAPYPPPKTEDAKSKVNAIREKLAEVEALEKTGKYSQGLELIQQLEKEVKAVDYQPVQAKLLYWRGVLLSLSGEHKKAENSLHDAARVAGMSRDALLSAKAMAWLVWVVGHSLAHFEAGLSIAKNAETMLGVAGGDAIVQASLLNKTGVLYHDIGKYEIALDNYQKALEIREKVLGPDHPLLAALLSNIGVVLQNQGKFDKSLQTYRKALSIQEKMLGPDHPDVAMSLNNLGLFFDSQGKLDKAKQCLQRSLAIWENALGPNHPNVAMSLNNIGDLYTEQGEYVKAFEYHQRALAIRKSVLGADHPIVASSLLKIGYTFQKQAKYNKALEYFRKSLSIWEKAMGPEHPYVALSLSAIGSVLVDQGRMKKARAHFERVVAICKENTCEPKSHGQSLFGLARSLVAIGGDNKRAINLARQAREIYGRIPRRFKQEREEVQLWLKKHDTQHGASATE